MPKYMMGERELYPFYDSIGESNYEFGEVELTEEEYKTFLKVQADFRYWQKKIENMVLRSM